ncbi:MAG: hypothetical protein ACLU9S_11710 [Oscillospiraceae bacterium]
MAPPPTKPRPPAPPVLHNHVIFRRATDQTAGEKLAQIRGSGSLSLLPAWCETVSSTQIREYVDKNLDISSWRIPLFSPTSTLNYFTWSPVVRTNPALGPYLNGVVAGARLCPLWTGTGQLGHLFSSRPRSAQEPPAGLQAIPLPASAPGNRSHDAAAYVRQHTSGRIMMVHSVVSSPPDQEGARRQLVNELLARSLQTDHTYALCRCTGRDSLYQDLLQLGFLPIPGQPDILSVDMRSPMVLIQDRLPDQRATGADGAW